MPMVAWRPVSMASAQLGADAVGARHQHRLLVPVQRNLEQRAETAQAAQHLGAHRALDRRLDALDEFIAGFDIDASVFVGDRLGGLHGRNRSIGVCYFTRRCSGVGLAVQSWTWKGWELREMSRTKALIRWLSLCMAWALAGVRAARGRRDARQPLRNRPAGAEQRAGRGICRCAEDGGGPGQRPARCAGAAGRGAERSA